MKIARTLLVAAVAIPLAVVVIGFAIGRVDLDGYRDEIDARLTSAIGLDVTIAGDLHAQLLPLPHFEVDRVSVANLPGSGSTPLLQIGNVDLTVELLPLLRGRIRIDHLRLANVEIHAETDADGNFRHEHDLQEITDESTSGPIDLEIRNVEIETAQVYFANRKNNQVTTFSVDQLELEDSGWGRPLLLSAAGTARGAAFDITATGGSLPVLLNGGAPYPISITGNLLGAQVELTGTVRDTLTFEGYDFQFDTTLPNLAGLVPDADAVLEQIGPIRAVGGIDDHDGKLRIRDLEGTITPGGLLHGSASGSVEDLYDLSGVKLVVELEVGDASTLTPVVGRPLPEDAAISIAATLSDKDGSLGIAGTITATANDGGWSLVVAGAHDDLREDDEIDVAIRLEARDVGAISDELGFNDPLPPIGPLAGTARLRDHQGAWSLADIDLKLGTAGDLWAEVTGAIDDLAKLEQVSLHLKFEAPKTHELLAHFDHKIPAGGSLQAAVHVTDAHGTLGLKDLRVRNAHPEVIDLDVSGSFEDLRRNDGIAIDARVSARDLAVIGELLGKELPAIGPFAYSGHIRGSNESAQSKGSLSLANTTIVGDLSGSWSQHERPSITAQLRSKHIRLKDIGFYSWSDAAADPTKVREDAKRLDDFFDALRRLDLDLSVAADRITGRGNLDLAKAGAAINLEKGDLQVRNARAIYSTGSVAWSLDVDASSILPQLAFRGSLRGVDLTHVVSQFDEDTKEAGIADIRFAFRSGGDSIAEVTRRLDGHLNARIRDGKIASSYAKHFIRELSAVSMPELRRHAEPQVACMLMDLSVASGQIAVERFSLDVQRAEISGTGRIDLVDDAYHLRLVPTSHDPSLLSIAATVDVTGPLSDPVFRVVPESIAISATRSLILNSTRPVRRLLGTVIPKSLHPHERSCPSPFDPTTASTD